MIKHQTDTSKWVLAIHRVSATTAEVWVGTLYPTMTKPRRARVRLELQNREVRTRIIQKNEWKRPFRNTNQRFWSLVSFRNLKSGTAYKVVFDRFVEGAAETGKSPLAGNIFVPDISKRCPSVYPEPPRSHLLSGSAAVTTITGTAARQRVPTRRSTNEGLQACDPTSPS